MGQQDGVRWGVGHVGEEEGDRRQRNGNGRAPQDPRIVQRKEGEAGCDALLPAGHRLPDHLRLRTTGQQVSSATDHQRVDNAISMHDVCIYLYNDIRALYSAIS